MRVCWLALAALGTCLAASPDYDKAKIIGSPTAPVMVEVYSSFACSHCKDFHERILPSIMKDYVAPGKVAIIPRECFPPSLPMALEAANEATAAARIGKYQEVAEALFRQQELWMATSSPWTAVASALTPEQQKRVQALSKDVGVMAEVQHDLKLANDAHVERTPTLILIRGSQRIPIPGGVPDYTLFKSLVDSLLAKK
jgi:protein-disulfide isomerase